MGKIECHNELKVYERAMEAAMTLFELSKEFPSEEKFSLTDQMRRCSRSVCANIAEAWRKRRYEAAFVAKLSDSEGEAAETQVWIEFAVRCKYLTREVGARLFREYDELLRMIVAMINQRANWVLS
jgi:four helix bundle protein